MEQGEGRNRSWGILVAFAVGALVWLLLRHLPDNQAAVAAVFAFTVALWVTEALPLTATALLSTALLVVVAGVDEKKAFSAYGDVIVPLFIGSFMLAKAMEVTGLSNRFAWLMLKQRWATRSPASLLLAMGIIGCVISLFVSNTATTAMLLPIGTSMLAVLGSEASRTPYAIGMMLMLTWGSSVAVGVPVGTPPNLIGIAQIEKATELKIGFTEWMMFAMPITIVMLLACWGVLWFLYRRNAPQTQAAGELANARYAELGRIGAAERNTLIAFFTALALWIAPDLLVAATEIASGEPADWANWIQKSITPAVAAIFGAGLLFLLPAKDGTEGRTLTWRQAATIDWGVIFLFAGGIALGSAMMSSGLGNTLGDAIGALTGANSVWAITAICTAAAIVLSELGSNTAAANALVPVAIALARGAGVSPIPPALGVAIGASFGFMLPVSTPPNAIVYSSGLVPQLQMIRSGVVIDAIGLVVTVVGLWLVLPAMGLAK